ncbi:hypothetical protein KW842_01870 [Duganella sp. sic0402]|uniref:hypothetical protein n=1 Tax=Duganella sp. sic0402 TaxID=2854786 RepID=UPI001C462080|nr:hypothetical protein [Duganella sp. sic0402]MBV7534504.1 hypothetical protein [Duganella sp. sic0402]
MSANTETELAPVKACCRCGDDVGRGQSDGRERTRRKPTVGEGGAGWYSANKSDPFQACFCGWPSNHLWMGQGFCCDAHYDQVRPKAAAEAAGKTGLPIFDGKSPIIASASRD